MHQKKFFFVGTCITTALPDDVCILDAMATTCGNFTANVCTCDIGYQFQNMMCTGIAKLKHIAERRDLEDVVNYGSISE